MSNFKVGDKVVRSDMNLNFVPSYYVKIFKGKVPLTVKSVEADSVTFREIEFKWASRRFKLYEETSKHRKHHDQIVAWAKGATIQYFEDGWHNITNNTPSWFINDRYRVKPTGRSYQQQKIDHIESEMRKLADQLSELKGVAEYYNLDIPQILIDKLNAN